MLRSYHSVVVIAAFVLLPDRSVLYYRGGSLLFAVGVAVMIGSLLSSPGWVGRILGSRPLVWIGLISYGIYLWHWPFMVWFTPERIHLRGATLQFAIVVATLSVSAASFYLIERPIRLLGRRKGTYRVIVGVGFVATIILVVSTTAGSTSAPNYFANVDGRPTECPPPSTSQVNALRDTMRPDQKKRTPEQRILVIGDSTACSLAVGFAAVAPSQNIQFTNASVVGCGVVSDIMAPVYVAYVDVTASSKYCEAAALHAETTALAESNPTAIVWSSGWEQGAITVKTPSGEQAATPGSELWGSTLLDRMNQRLEFGGRQRGTRLLADSTSRGRSWRQEPDSHGPCCRALERAPYKFASQHQDQVSIVDMAGIVCPGGPPCPRVVDGVVLRPDHVHFGNAGSLWVAQRLAPEFGFSKELKGPPLDLGWE